MPTVGLVAAAALLLPMVFSWELATFPHPLRTEGMWTHQIRQRETYRPAGSSQVKPSVAVELVVAAPFQLPSVPMLELAISPHPTVELVALAKSPHPRVKSALSSPTMVAVRGQLRTVPLMTLATSPHPMAEVARAAAVVTAVMVALATSAHPMMELAVA